LKISHSLRTCGVFIFATLLCASATQFASGQAVGELATDQASNYTAWGSTSSTPPNGGTGFGAWSFNDTGTIGSQSGEFLGSSPEINSSNGNSWGMFANSSQTADVNRTITNNFAVGNTLSLQMDNKSINSGGSDGFSLRNASGQNLFEFYFTGGNPNYSINDSSSSTRNTGIGFTSTGLQLDFTLTGATAYSLSIKNLSSSTVTTLIGNLLNPAGGQTLSILRFFDFNSGSSNNLYFNKTNVLLPTYTATGSTSWSTAANWSNTTNGQINTLPISGNNIAFNGAAGGTANNDITTANLSGVNSITFNSGAGSYTLSANSGSAGGTTALNLGDSGATNAGIVNNSANLQTINDNLALTAAAGSGSPTTINAASGAITVGGTINLGANTNRLLVTGSNAVNLNGGISSTGGDLLKQGTGTLTLAANNTFTGGTFIDQGTVSLTAAGSLSYNGAIQLGSGVASSNNATLTLGATGGGQTLTSAITVTSTDTGTKTIQALNTSGTNTFSGGITATGSFTIDAAAGGTTVLSGVIGGGGNISITDTGTVTLSNTNTYTGSTTISAGTLNATNNSALGSSTGGGLIMNPSSGTATVNFTTAAPSIGSLASSGAGTSAIVLGSSGVNTTLTIGGNNTSTAFAGTIQDFSGQTDAVTKTGTGTLTLSNGSNSFSGGLNLNGGTVSSTAQGAIGTGGLSFNTGTLSIDTNAQTYSNNITIAGGGTSGATINANTANGIFNGTIANGGNRLIVTGANNTTLGGVISGAGDLLKQGAGTLTLGNASNSFGGASNAFMDQGTISVSTTGALGATDGATTGLVNMGSSVTGGLNTNVNIANSSVTLANPILVRYLQTGGKTLSGTFTSGSSTFSGAISLADHLTIAAANGGTLLFTGVISQAAGTGSGTPGAGFVNNTSPTGGFSTNGPGVIINSGASSTGIVEYDNAMTYVGDTVVNSGTLQFNGSGSLASSTIRLGALGAATLNLISPTGSTLNVTVNVRSANSIISASNTSGTSTLGGHFALDANATVQEASSTGTLAITQAHNLANTTTGTDIKGFTLTLTPTGTINISGDIYNSTGTGNVTMNGSGMTVLSGTNTYSGTTTLSSGTLDINSATALGTSTITITGGTIDNTSAGAITLSNNNAQNWNGDFAFTGTKDLNLGTGAVTMNASRIVTVNGGNLTVGGAISGTGDGLTKAGAGTLILTGANAYTGTTTISAGTLQLGNITTTGSLSTSSAITDNGILSFSRTNAVTQGTDFSGSAITGTGSLTQNRGTLTLNAANTYQGGTRLNGGTLDINNASAIGTGTLTFTSNGTIDNTTAGALTLSTNNAITLGSFTYGGTNDLNLGTGAITAASGTLITLNGSGRTLTLGGTLTTNSSLQLNVTGSANTLSLGGINLNSTQLTFAGDATISVAGSITNSTNSIIDGMTGTLTLLSGTSTWSGGIQLGQNNGTINIGADSTGSPGSVTSGPLGTGTFTIGIAGTGGTIQAVGGAHTVANTVSLDSNVTFSGSNSLTLSGTLTNIGDTATDTLTNNITGNGNSLTLGAINIHILSQTGNLAFAGTGNTNITGAIADGDQFAGAITYSGTGTLTLSGSNTYTGSTTINAGILNSATFANAGSASGIGQAGSAAANLVFGGGTLQYTGSSAASTNHLFTIGDANGNTATLDASGSGSGTLSFTNTGAIAFGNTSAHTLTLTGTNTGANTLAPVIGNNTGLTSVTKNGAGSWTLTGANTYTGTTTVNAGSLFVNGNQSAATGAVNVNNIGTTLGGSGTIGGAVTVVSGANLSPGATGVGSTAILHTGALTLNSGSNFNVDLNNTTAGSGYDQLIAPSLSITGSNLAVAIGGTLSVGNQFFIAENTGASAVTGTFNGLAEGATFNSGADEFMISYVASSGDGTNGNDILLTLVAVPEPSTWFAAALSLGAIGFTQRRRLARIVRR
jgi:fibronectin-binding autotransporter adhesin